MLNGKCNSKNNRGGHCGSSPLPGERFCKDHLKKSEKIEEKKAAVQLKSEIGKSADIPVKHEEEKEKAKEKAEEKTEEIAKKKTVEKTEEKTEEINLNDNFAEADEALRSKEAEEVEEFHDYVLPDDEHYICDNLGTSYPNNIFLSIFLLFFFLCKMNQFFLQINQLLQFNDSFFGVQYLKY